MKIFFNFAVVVHLMVEFANFKERIVNVKLKDISAWSTEHLPKNWVTERNKTLRKVS